MKEFGVILLTTGEPTFGECLKSVEAQTTKPKQIVIKRNISPISRAYNLGYNEISTEFVIEVHADLILKPNAFETLLKNMNDEGEVYGLLYDTDKKYNVEAIRLVRKKALKSIGGYRDVPDMDWDSVLRMQKAGWAIKKISKVLGEHRPYSRGFQHIERQWNIGKRAKSLREYFYGIKTAGISFVKTGNIKFVFFPFFTLLGFFFGKREDVRYGGGKNEA
jgi:glycosyltransferase involved in cell wall biosynthesis